DDLTHDGIRQAIIRNGAGVGREGAHDSRSPAESGNRRFFDGRRPELTFFTRSNGFAPLTGHA
ncbi:MAG TPA: hypothetical protein VFW49_14245, partial [Fluviicoccus sp.]|nr:hypothetical protein [Fluviicoccus sp.]